jgi:hypothetical protein
MSSDGRSFCSREDISLDRKTTRSEVEVNHQFESNQLTINTSENPGNFSSRSPSKLPTIFNRRTRFISCFNQTPAESSHYPPNNLKLKHQFFIKSTIFIVKYSLENL